MKAIMSERMRGILDNPHDAKELHRALDKLHRGASTATLIFENGEGVIIRFMRSK